MDESTVKYVMTPVHLEYDFTPGFAPTRFLRGLAQGKILGARAGDDGPVYVPPRGSDPKTGLPTDQVVEVSDTGTIVSFSVVRVPSENLSFEPPYACVSVLLDGADIPFFHVMQECPLDEIRMGMRVQAKWAPPEKRGPTVESIEYFRPIDEPDADYDSYKEHT